MTATLRSEWTKLRTQRGTLVALATTAVLMAGMTAWFASESETNAQFGGDDDVVQMGLAGIVFAQLAVVVVGASLITGEYATKMLRTTLTATPGRLRVLVAKALILVAVMLPLGVASSAVAFAIAQPLLHDGGYVAPAYPPVSLTDPVAIRAIIGTGLLLTAYALLALGGGDDPPSLGRDDRDRRRAAVPPVPVPRRVPRADRDPHRAAHAARRMAIQSSTDRMLAPFDGRLGMPIGPWQGLGVAFAWALGALAIGYALLRARDV